jgi:phosphoenolpyruvate carboxylase
MNQRWVGKDFKITSRLEEAKVENERLHREVEQANKESEELQEKYKATIDGMLVPELNDLRAQLEVAREINRRLKSWGVDVE